MKELDEIDELFKLELTEQEIVPDPKVKEVIDDIIGGQVQRKTLKKSYVITLLLLLGMSTWMYTIAKDKVLYSNVEMQGADVIIDAKKDNVKLSGGGSSILPFKGNTAKDSIVTEANFSQSAIITLEGNSDESEVVKVNSVFSRSTLTEEQLQAFHQRRDEYVDYLDEGWMKEDDSSVQSAIFEKRSIDAVNELGNDDHLLTALEILEIDSSELEVEEIDSILVEGESVLEDSKIGGIIAVEDLEETTTVREKRGWKLGVVVGSEFEKMRKLDPIDLQPTTVEKDIEEVVKSTHIYAKVEASIPLRKGFYFMTGLGYRSTNLESVGRYQQLIQLPPDMTAGTSYPPTTALQSIDVTRKYQYQAIVLPVGVGFHTEILKSNFTVGVALAFELSALIKTPNNSQFNKLDVYTWMRPSIGYQFGKLHAGIFGTVNVPAMQHYVSVSPNRNVLLGTGISLSYKF